MKLFAVLCWWDESPTWLAGCVASLSKIGVDHLIVVDGRYPHFEPGALPNSAIEQAEAILVTAASAGMGVTLHRPTQAALTEAQKRELCHRLVELVGEPMKDWFLVIDADEYVESGDGSLRQVLHEQPMDTHCVALRVASTLDPNAEPGADNGVNERTAEIHRKLPVDQRFVSLQSRVWRVMHDMRVGPAHYHYTGVDTHGDRWYLRPDIGSTAEAVKDRRATEIHREHSVCIVHRKNWRTKIRRDAKDTYYKLRDEMGLERS